MAEVNKLDAKSELMALTRSQRMKNGECFIVRRHAFRM